jgi:hypothetical protein
MSEIRFRLNPVHVGVALAVIAILAAVKVATLGESDDPKLHEAIRTELLSELGGRIGQELQSLDTEDRAAVAAFTEHADPDAIEVHSASVSKPLLSVGTSTNAVVRVEYTLPGGPRQIVYWRFKHSAMAGWRYRYETSALAYYTNLI